MTSPAQRRTFKIGLWEWVPTASEN
jgi:hypothetical protein